MFVVSCHVIKDTRTQITFMLFFENFDKEMGSVGVGNSFCGESWIRYVDIFGYSESNLSGCFCFFAPIFLEVMGPMNGTSSFCDGRLRRELWKNPIVTFAQL